MKGKRGTTQPARLVQLLMPLTLVLVLPVASAAVEVGEKAPVEGTGTITGVVKFAGTPPPPVKFRVSTDITGCGTERWSKALIIGLDRGVQHAVITLVGIQGPPKRPTTAPTLDQVGCEFIPRVVIAPVGSPIIILNTDNFLHTFHTISVKNAPVDKAQPNLRRVLKEKFDKPEIIEVKCDLHSWMKAWIVVAEHPYYTVTDGTGAFVLTDVPAGSYQLRVWHETLGEEEKDVVVNAGAEANVTFELLTKWRKTQGWNRGEHSSLPTTGRIVGAPPSD